MNVCRCKRCRRAKRDGLILGSRLLKYLGDKAYFVSDYVRFKPYRKGRRPNNTSI